MHYFAVMETACFSARGHSVSPVAAHASHLMGSDRKQMSREVFRQSVAVPFLGIPPSWLGSGTSPLRAIPNESMLDNRGRVDSTRKFYGTFRDVCSSKATNGARSSGSVVNDGVARASMAVAIRDLNLVVEGDRGDVPILRNCSLNVPEGQLWMLLGPNGCGKSTLLKAMVGLLRPSRGHMFVQGPRSFVFQNPDHQVVMPTAEADVAFGLGRFDLPYDEVRRRVHSSLDAVGMSEYAQRSVQTLSGGQKQRIAIAGALAESSRVLLLDELTTYLDRADQMGVLEAVRKVVGGPEGVTAVWVTHRLEELDYADGAAYMEDGRMVLSGSVRDIRKHIQKQQEEFRKGRKAFR